MTFWELDLAIKAKAQHEKNQRWLAAVHASWIMNMWTKRTVRPQRLIRDRSGREDLSRFRDQADALEYYRQRDKQMVEEAHARGETWLQYSAH